MFTLVSPFTRVYLCLVMITYVYHSLFVHVYQCLPCLLVFTYTYLSLPMFTRASLHAIISNDYSWFTFVYSCLPTFTPLY